MFCSLCIGVPSFKSIWIRLVVRAAYVVVCMFSYVDARACVWALVVWIAIADTRSIWRCTHWRTISVRLPLLFNVQEWKEFTLPLSGLTGNDHWEWECWWNAGCAVSLYPAQPNRTRISPRPVKSMNLYLWMNIESIDLFSVFLIFFFLFLFLVFVFVFVFLFFSVFVFVCFLCFF